MRGDVRRLGQRGAVVVIVGTGIATVLAAASRAGWLFELFAHFRVHYLVLQLLALALLLFSRAYGWAAAAVLLAIPNALVVGPYLPGLLVPTAPATVAGTPTTLVAINLRYTNTDVGRVRRYLDDARPDVLVLSEFTPAWRKALRELETDYPYYALRPHLDPWGIALYSRYPLRLADPLDLGDRVSANLRVVIDLLDGPVEVFAIHLLSPTRPTRARLRNSQLAILAAGVAASTAGLPQIVIGDTNLTPFSPYFGDLLRAAGLRDARQPFGLQATWPAWPLPLWLPIDHCLVSPRIGVQRIVTGPAVGSDHYPLEVEFWIRG